MNSRDTSHADSTALSVPRATDLRTAGDAWSQTLWLLYALCSHQSSKSEKCHSHRHCRPAGSSARSRGANPTDAALHRTAIRDKSAPAVITVVERLSATIVVLRWCSGFCHYADQVWTQQRARGTGVCAVSGTLIRCGDSVFRPRDRGHDKPANADAMIHPSVIDRYDETQDMALSHSQVHS